ncbi:YkvA family protein [Noviherbaspirillum autotrophicum]|uniref:DUF1232 domain-containing protein n=1 Tax=Noviherbaspirillum autotrophicum TaxID=709839 RepID=A0A0C1Y0B5_9BURK|nr:YkvA family protein [Noviherbaspirillum autotrophicum]KIF80458.1 hypothetical protein TSA66_05920 [Noviherbaspirillum autotrophicum]
MFFRLRRLLRTAGRDLVVLWYAFRHPDTPGAVKLLSILLALYVFSPIDLVPDALPVLGWLDDATLLAIGIPAILKLMPQSPLLESYGAADRFLSRWIFWRKRS